MKGWIESLKLAYPDASSDTIRIIVPPGVEPDAGKETVTDALDEAGLDPDSVISQPGPTP